MGQRPGGRLWAASRSGGLGERKGASVSKMGHLEPPWTWNPMSTLADLAITARESGWAVGSMPARQVRWEATALGWEEVATRKGDSPVAVLRPTTTENAHPQSLSARHGLNEQPLHTDGAHLQEPPDYVVLHSALPNGTPTLLWSHVSRLTNAEHSWFVQPTSLFGGIFVVRTGASGFLAHSYDYRTGYRYDPGCMTPADERAHEAARYFATLTSQAFPHEWTDPDQVLVIHNRWSLHARAAVGEGDTERELTRIAYRVKSTS